MQTKLFLSFILLLSSSWVVVVYSDQGAGASLPVPGNSMICVEKLLPCQTYLASEEKPPESCCAPLKEAIGDQQHCLCSVLNDVLLLKSLNMNQSDILKLPTACQLEVDTSACSKVTTSSTNFPAATTSTPEAHDSSSSSSTPATESSASGISLSSGPGFLAVFVSLVFVRIQDVVVLLN